MNNSLSELEEKRIDKNNYLDMIGLLLKIKY